jgi:hypothetical protein
MHIPKQCTLQLYPVLSVIKTVSHLVCSLTGFKLLFYVWIHSWLSVAVGHLLSLLCSVLLDEQFTYPFLGLLPYILTHIPVCSPLQGRFGFPSGTEPLGGEVCLFAPPPAIFKLFSKVQTSYIPSISE